MKRFSVFPVMLVFLLTLGLAFTACDNGSTGGGNKFLGLPYSVKFDHKDNFGGELTTYILECSYDEAFEILTQKFGRWHEQVSAQGFWFLPNNDFINYLAANPDYVMLQDCVDFGEYRLVHKYRPDDPNDDESDGFNWYKPYERQGTLRITGIPAQYEGKEVGFHIFGWLYYDYVVTNLWDETFYYLYDDLPKVSDGSVDLHTTMVKDLGLMFTLTYLQDQQ